MNKFRLFLRKVLTSIGDLW